MRCKSEETMEQIKNAVEEFYFSHYRSPSIGELAAEVGYAKSTVHSYLWEMDRRGLLSYNGKTAETAVTRKANAEVVLTPVLGSISCGEPEYAEENFESYVALPTALFGSGEFFLLRARGYSMVEAGIEPGDLVLINFISQAEIEELCEAMLRQHLGQEEPIPQSVDIDGFVQNYLKCRILYETFAEADPNKIGFTGDGRAPLKIKRDGQALSVVFPFKTIVLDRYLLRPEEHTHRRFTLGHEAGHLISMRINPESAACFHRTHDRERTYSLQEMQEIYSISEWQANTFSASLLMPRSVMYETLKRFNGGKRLPVYGETVFHPREKVILQKMADALEVSYTALVIRLRGLGMLNHHDISEYIEKELQLGGNTS